MKRKYSWRSPFAKRNWKPIDARKFGYDVHALYPADVKCRIAQLLTVACELYHRRPRRSVSLNEYINIHMDKLMR